MKTTTKHHEIPAAHFSKKTLRALSKKGITLIGMTTIPTEAGNFAGGETGYLVDDNGTGRVLTYLQIAA